MKILSWQKSENYFNTYYLMSLEDEIHCTVMECRDYAGISEKEEYYAIRFHYYPYIPQMEMEIGYIIQIESKMYKSLDDAKTIAGSTISRYIPKIKILSKDLDIYL